MQNSPVTKTPSMQHAHVMPAVTIAAAIFHLFRVGEGLGMQLLSLHNVATMNRLMREVRAAIRSNTLDQVQKEWVV